LQYQNIKGVKIMDLKDETPEFKGRSISLSLLNVTITISSSYPGDDINTLKSVIYEILEKVGRERL
jgi:hypothetical protein